MKLLSVTTAAILAVSSASMFAQGWGQCPPGQWCNPTQQAQPEPQKPSPYYNTPTPAQQQQQRDQEAQADAWRDAYTHGTPRTAGQPRGTCLQPIIRADGTTGYQPVPCNVF